MIQLKKSKNKARRIKQYSTILAIWYMEYKAIEVMSSSWMILKESEKLGQENKT